MIIGWHTTTGDAVQVVALPLESIRACANSVNRSTMRIMEMMQAFNKLVAEITVNDLVVFLPHSWAEFSDVMTRGFPKE